MKLRTTLLGLLMLGCAGMSRQCGSSLATGLGADWVIVQFGAGGLPFNCWRLKGVSVANEEHTDGIYWEASDGHLVHISGWYNRVQVEGGRWEEASKAVGVELSRCVGGAYRERGSEKQPAAADGDSE